jgi:hypothetical protein
MKLLLNLTAVHEALGWRSRRSSPPQMASVAPRPLARELTAP